MTSRSAPATTHRGDAGRRHGNRNGRTTNAISAGRTIVILAGVYSSRNSDNDFQLVDPNPLLAEIAKDAGTALDEHVLGLDIAVNDGRLQAR
jgi:hypothetical protein